MYWFSRLVVRRPLYGYQLEVARAIVDSVLHERGLELAVMFPRQSGKNETQAQVEAYLLNLFQWVGGQIVKAQPTRTPQAANAMLRLEAALNNDWNRLHWEKHAGYRYTLGEAHMLFFSADAAAKVVGATASLLLEADEAQDVLEAEWQKKFIPMGASTNATVVYWGTAWTSRTLLARTIRSLQAQEAQDGVRRVFIVTPDQVTAENPNYGAFVARQVAKLGRNHPLVKTQFFNEEIDAEGGMFPPARRALMQGDHAPLTAPEPGRPSAVYAFLLDVAGEDEGALSEAAIDAPQRRTGGVGAGGGAAALDPQGAFGSNPRRDSTALTIVEVDLASVSDPVIAAPTYRAVARHLWTGTKHATLYGQLKALADLWRPRYFVVDATGVGAGLASFLANSLPPGVLMPFEFTSVSKSRLGWEFLAICDTRRWKEWAWEVGSEKWEVGSTNAPSLTSHFSLLTSHQAAFWREAEFCQYEVLPGPSRLLRWAVPNGTRDPSTGELVHDDLLMSAALSAVLDEQPWYADTGPTAILRAGDPLEEMDRGF